MSDAATQGAPALVEVLPNHRFDEAALARYLAGRLPGFSHGTTILRSASESTRASGQCCTSR
jgi:hypothetical protein